MVIKSVSSTEHVILFRLALRGFCTEAYTSTLRCSSGRNCSKFGVHKTRQKATPKMKVCTSLADSYISSHTSNNSPQNSGALLMGCVTASGAPDSSRRHPKATLEVFFVDSKLRASSTNISQNRPNVSRFTRGSLVRKVYHR